MNQGNGSDLLGINDPRGAKIGVIYVSPTDDRKSVLAAILTQEKLGRKQVAVVLPDQNRAFQRPQDFDDLKSVRRKLQTEIVFIAPDGAGPAEFARQRRFPVYSSLEGFAQTLNAQEPAPLAVESKKGRFFGGPRQRAAEPEKAAILPKPAPLNGNVPARKSAVRRQGEAGGSSSIARDAAVAGAIGAGAVAAGAAAGHYLYNNHEAMPVNTAPQDSQEEDWDALPPAAPATPTNGTHAAPPPSVPATPARTNGARADASAQQAPHAEDDLDEEAALAAGGAAAVAASPTIIDLPRRGRSTLNLAGAPANTNAAPPPTPARNVTQRRNSGKMAAAAAVGAVGALAATGTGSPTSASASGGAVVPRAGGGADQPPVRTGGNGGGGRGPQRRRSRFTWLIALLLFLVTLAVAAGVLASVYPSVVPAPLKHVLSNAQSPATVTITPDSQKVQDSYLIQAVTGTPNPAQRQVGLRELTYTTPTVSKPVTGTGHTQTAPVAATGTLTFINGSSAAFTVSANTPITASNGAVVEPNFSATIPASNLPTTIGAITVRAHAITTGSAGNITAGTINQNCCAAGNFITVKNGTFSGGKDPQDYTFVQQSDVNGVVGPLLTTLRGQAQTAFQAQLRSNEQLLGTPDCTTSTNTSNTVGDTGVNIPSLNVSVTATCKGQAYDQGAVQTLVTQLLQNKAASSPGAGYSLVGKIQTTISLQQPTNANNVSLLANAQGVWSYQFTNAQEQNLKQMIINKSIGDATTLLKAQKGIGAVNIQTTSSTLPSDPGQINIVVQPVAGLVGGVTPPAVSSGGPSNPSNGPGQPEPTPVPGKGNGTIIDGVA